MAPVEENLHKQYISKKKKKKLSKFIIDIFNKKK